MCDEQWKEQVVQKVLAPANTDKEPLEFLKDNGSFNISRTFLKRKNWLKENRQLLTNMDNFHLNANFKPWMLFLNLIQLFGPSFWDYN